MIDKEDRRWLIITSIIFLLITSLPYLLGYFRQGADWRFTGFVFGVEDGNSYIAKMLSGSYGSWLFRSPYSSIPQKGMFAFLPFILAGKLAANPEIHGQLVVLFQIFRWAADALLVYAVFQFVGLFLFDRKIRRIATLIILFGGGLGWLGWIIFPSNWTGRLPLEVYSPEAFGFLSFLGLPHLSAARAFLLLGFTIFLKNTGENQNYRQLIFGGILWFIAGFFQPLTIVVGYVILGINFLIKTFLSPQKNWTTLLIQFKRYLVFAIISSPWVLYNFFSFSGDAYLSAWYKQNIISSPPLQDYFWSYGLFLIAAVPTILQILKKRENPGSILIAWLVCAASLAYFPYNVQRRFIDGVWIALVILVVLSYKIFKKTKWSFFYKSVFSSTIAAPILVMMVVLHGAWLVKTPVYRPAAEVAMFEVIEKTAITDDVVLCSYETGNALPAWASVFVLAGHGPESANLKEIKPEIAAFYSGSKDLGWQEDFLAHNNVSLIISGPVERTLGDWESRFGSDYVRINKSGEYRIYRVEKSDGK
jgi:hypothetical protein